MPPRIGDILLTRGLLDQSQLEIALSQQRRTGERLGRVVLTLGMVTRVELARALAELWDRPFIVVTPEMVHPAAARRFPLESTPHFRAVPLTDDGTTVVVASSIEPTRALSETLTVVYPGRVLDVRITTEWDIDHAIGIAHRRQMVDGSIHGLYFRQEEETAFYLFTIGQAVLFALALIGLVASLWYNPLVTLVVTTFVTSVLFALPTLFRLLVSLAETPTRARTVVTSESMHALRDLALPIYSILIPFEGEADEVGDLLAALGALDYPVDKLDIVLLFHEDDTASLNAAKSAAPPGNVRLLVVPAVELYAKPMATNVGLLYAAGEYVVVYDPSDRPEVDQLRKAVSAFRAGPRRLACLQAMRAPRYSRRNLFGPFATIDQLTWFDHLLPGLDRWRLPVPIGGTSNHFRTEVLRSLGGWDPFNVTEDSDLGVRAAIQGHRAGTLNSRTSVLLPRTPLAWFRERTRWIRGFVQTALLHLRDPITLTRTLGIRRTVGFLMLIAATPVSYLMQAIGTGLMILWVTGGATSELNAVSIRMLDGALLALLLGYGSLVSIHLFTAIRHRRLDLALLAPLAPLYRLLLSIPAAAAVIQLLLHPSRGIPSETMEG